ncbi:DUF397 domain-containing protein [Streptomyces sp. M92]|uniref:DUF397 domain-containing protein n=1 Tax=Streptomyces sp. M92 TaxID=2944250 RepID=UPI00234BA1F1|nr:DUF397 domain-containing protein [Streptomyces sp. M92]WCN07024.1 DUF397 domain-containing protein [Streptomyces sp. M92]
MPHAVQVACGGGEGNACVEIAHRHSHIAVRDSRAPTRATLAFPTPAFTAFLTSLKTPAGE